MIERTALDPGHPLHPHQRRHDEVSWLLAWLDLQSLAAWKPLGDLDRGQLEASRSELAQRWGWTESKVRRFLNRLEALNEIEWDRGGGADKSRLRISRYDEIQLGSSSRRERLGTDPPSDPPSRPPKARSTQGDSRGHRPPVATNHRSPHIYTEEEENNGRAREGKKDEPAPVEKLLRAAWAKVREAYENGHLEDLVLDPVGETAFQRAGGIDALESARRQPHGLAQVKNRFRQAYHELSSFRADDEVDRGELVL